MIRFLFSALLLIPAVLLADDHYRVVFSDSLDKVTVEACFDGKPPRYLYRSSSAAPFIDFIEADGRRIDPSTRYGRFRLPSMPENRCARWRVDLAAAVSSAGDRVALDVDGTYLTNTNLWFWRDNDRRDIRVSVRLPTGMSLSVPWPEVAGSEGQEFRPAATPAGWSSRSAIGNFDIQRVPVPGTTLRLATIGNLDRVQQTRYFEWMRETGTSVASVYDEFPQPEPQILVVPIGPRNEVVPWAHVIRGGGPAVEFFVDETRGIDSLREDWTATHELSHLLLPLVSSRDRWLSEGLASYYQNVLRARDGRLTELEAWQKLHSGFERGRKATRKGQDLASATRDGWGSVMRVYWSGAAMMLKADASLRRLSGGQQSLDTALGALHDCCFDTNRSWRASELFSQLDTLTGYAVFTDLYREHVTDESFPDLDDTYQHLGVVSGSRKISLDPEAPGSRIRYFIMRDGATRDELGLKRNRSEDPAAKTDSGSGSP